MSSTASANSNEVDLVIRNGLVATASTSGVTDVAISDGVVVGLGRGPWKGRRDINADGLVVIPGGVDPHTHLNNWPFGETRTPVDDFESGSQAAAAGGITTVCDFAYIVGDRPIFEEVRRLERQIELKSRVDVALHISITSVDKQIFAEIPELISGGFPSFKFYTQLQDYSDRTDEYIRLLALIGSLGGTAMFHCEDQSIIDYCASKLRRAGHTSPRYYGQSKPVEVEVSGTAQALAHASVAGVRAYIVHMSCAAALDEVMAARSRGADVVAETRPIYLHLTDDRFDQADADAALHVGTPPLRACSDRERLWTALSQGDIDTLGSDHVGFMRSEKYLSGDTFETVPKGVSNLQTMLPMMYSEGVGKGRISLQCFVAAVAETPARTFGLYPQKGTIAKGADADICILDPQLSKEVTVDGMYSRSDFDVFEGWRVTGWPILTLLRGEVVYEAGQVTSAGGIGRLVRGTPYRPDEPGGEILRRGSA